MYVIVSDEPREKTLDLGGAKIAYTFRLDEYFLFF